MFPLVRLTRPWGRRGELIADGFSSQLRRLPAGSRVYLRGGAGSMMPAEAFVIDHSREHQGRLVLKFRGVDSISDAERLRGAEVSIPMREREEAPEGEYYLADLLGWQVVDRNSNCVLGQVRGWQEFGGPVLLEVAGEAGQILIPFVRTICREIDAGAKQIGVEMPEGLRDLNRP